jgi:hypothetical protein
MDPIDQRAAWLRAQGAEIEAELGEAPPRG